MDEAAAKLQQWASAEMNFRPLHQKEHKTSDLQSLCRGQLKDVWLYFTKNVRPIKTAERIRGNVLLAQQQKNETECGEQYRQLTAEVAASGTAVRHVDREIKRLHTDISSTESKICKHEQQLDDERRRAALLTVQSKQIHEKIAVVRELTARVNAKKAALETQRGQVKQKMHSVETQSRPESGCTREVKGMCVGMETFLGDLLDGKFSGDKDAMSGQKERSRQSLHDLLQKHSVHQLLVSLSICCNDSSLSIRHNTSSIDIQRDLQALGFQYSSSNGQLRDVSSSPSLLLNVRQLLQESHQNNIQRFICSEQSRNRAWQLQKTLVHCQEALANMLQSQLSEAPQALEVATHLMETELQLMMCRSSVRVLNEAGVELKEQMAEALRNKEILVAKYQRIQDFRKIADAKQNLIRVIVKQNMGAQERLEAQKADVVQYVQTALSSKQGDIHREALLLKDGVQKEFECFASLSIALLVLGSIDGSHKTSTADLSISRLESNPNSALQSIARALQFTFHQSPELLTSALVELCRDANTPLNLKQLSSASSADRISGLCEAVRAHDQNVLKTSVPVLQTSLAETTRTLTDCLQLKDTVSHWWEQPAQEVVPWLCVDDDSLRQWRDRWTVQVTQLRQAQKS